MPDTIYKPVKFFSLDVSEAQEFITDEDDEIITDEQLEPLTAG